MFKSQNGLPSPILFKANNSKTFEEKYFESSKDAYTFMKANKNWTLKKRETISWTYPLEQIITEQCWIKVG